MAARKTAAGDLVGVVDIGRMLGISKQRAGQLMDPRTNPDAPEAMELTRGRVWKRADVVKYAREVLHREVLEVPR